MMIFKEWMMEIYKEEIKNLTDWKIFSDMKTPQPVMKVVAALWNLKIIT